MVRLIARRALLGRLAAVLGAGPALPAAATRRHAKSGKSGSLTAFRLVTGCKAQGGCACNACKQHAAHKLFASHAAVVRAHSHCNCQVKPQPLPHEVWAALFGLPERPATLAVDKRDPRVQQILGHAPWGEHKSHHHHH